MDSHWEYKPYLWAGPTPSSWGPTQNKLSVISVDFSSWAILILVVFFLYILWFLIVCVCVHVCVLACVCVFLCALYTVLLVCLCIFVFYREKAKVRGWKGREVERWGGPGKGWGRGTMIRICCKGKIFPIQKNEKIKRIRISSFTSDSQNCPMSESPRVLYSDLRSEFWHGCHKRRTV